MQREPDHISETEILSAKQKRRIADELSISPGIFAALCVAALVCLGLFMLHGSAILPATGHSLFGTGAKSGTAANVPLSPRATVAMRFYFDSEPRRQM